MRRLFAAFVLASTVSLGAMIPSASAQIPGFQSFGFTGNTPFFSTGLNAGVVQCQAGGQINTTTGAVTPFFQATAAAPVLGPGPCVPPIGFGLGGFGLGGVAGQGGLGAGGLANLTLAQAIGLGLGTATAAGNVITFTPTGGTGIALTAGQTLNTTTLGQLCAANVNACANFGLTGGFGLGLNGLGGNVFPFGLNGANTLNNLVGFPGSFFGNGLGFGNGFFGGIGGLNQVGVGGAVNGFGTVNGIPGLNCTNQGAFTVCQ